IGAALTTLTAAPVVAEAAPAKPAATAPAAAPKPSKSGHIEANGVTYYYEVRGSGPPLLLLHGGLGSIDMFAPIMADLTARHTVIGVDLQGHGRTVLGDRPFSLQAQGADMATILTKLGYGKADVLGYSLGGGVAFQLAVQHPERVNKLVLLSTGYAQDGFYADMLKQQAQVSAQAAPFMKDTPMYTSYVAVAPRPQDFPKLLDTLGAFMRQSYDFSADVAKLTMPTLLVFGDSDMYRPEHEVKFFQMLGGGLKDGGWQREHVTKNRLAILPGRTHYDIFLAPEFLSTALTFIEGREQVASWQAATAK
ncbi:alpha/beta hydrolase, partial [Phenylobacterium sp.]|uniref:alpha/beta fold hydrolase n=1 Tax=Phenylobacterium sp. TaxID=1871053 RepID=UPI002EDB488F